MQIRDRLVDLLLQISGTRQCSRWNTWAIFEIPSEQSLRSPDEENISLSKKLLYEL